MHKVIFWLTLTGISLIFLKMISSTLTPFVVAFVLAYILAPIIDTISNLSKIPRIIVVHCVFAIFLGFFIAALVVVTPLLYQQLYLFLQKIPIYRDYLQTELVGSLSAKIAAIDQGAAEKIQGSFHTLISAVFALVSSVFSDFWSYTAATLNIVVILLFTPVILIYLLLDWSKVFSSIDDVIPLKAKPKIKEILSSINQVLSDYLLGQVIVCLSLAFYYTIGFSIMGIDFAMLLGFISGFIVLIPYIGTIIAMTASLTICYVTFGITYKLLMVVGLYGLGMNIDGYFLTPKIIGNKIGVHPLWIMFAVVACGSLFGFTGVFFAVPIAGIVRVLLGYGVEFYKASSLYTE